MNLSPEILAEMEVERGGDAEVLVWCERTDGLDGFGGCGISMFVAMDSYYGDDGDYSCD